MKRIYLLFSVLCLIGCVNAQDRITEIKNRLSDKESGYVAVVAHRGDWRNYCENSLEAIQSCIDMGVDIVEIDLAQTKDGELILMHDRKLDRTTSGKGLVSDYTLAEIKEMRLWNAVNVVTEFEIPTLKEAMQLAQGKIMVNLDKADKYFGDVFRILEETGTVEQTILKSSRPYNELKKEMGEQLDQMIFMPVVHIRDTTTTEQLRQILEKQYPFYELVFQENGEKMVRSCKEALQGSSSLIWINSLWPSLCAGYSDDRALKNADETWGHLIGPLGARIVQTDRPARMIEYLATKHRRQVSMPQEIEKQTSSNVDAIPHRP